MLDTWKERRKTERQIKAIEDRIQRSAATESATLIGYSVANARFEIDLLRGHLKRSETERLIARAVKHGIVVPQFDEYWQTDEATKKDCLTDEGEKLILTSIRDKRFAAFGRWSPIFAVLISLLALVVSIIALWKK
jgi:hypothetical protein